MKQLLLLLTIGMLYTAKGQGTAFKYEVSKEVYIPKGNNPYRYKMLVPNKYVVIHKEGTAKELYGAIIRFIDSHWNSPEDVVKVNREDYIRVNGAYDRVYEFRFKDGKIKYSTNLPNIGYVRYKKNGQPAKRLSDGWFVYYGEPTSFYQGKPQNQLDMANLYLEKENAIIKKIVLLDLIEDIENDF